MRGGGLGLAVAGLVAPVMGTQVWLHYFYLTRMFLLLFGGGGGCWKEACDVVHGASLAYPHALALRGWASRVPL